MAEKKPQILQKIAKGTGISFLGTVTGLLFAFTGRVLVARIGTEAEYGIFSLAFVLLNIGALIGSVGLQQGATRSIAFARGEKDSQKVRELINASLQFGLFAGVILALIVFLTSDLLATKVFHEAGLAFPLKIFAIGIPFLTLIYVFSSIFRGFDEIKPKVYFQDVLRNLIFPTTLLIFIFLNLPFEWVFYAFLFSLILSCSVFGLYTRKKITLTPKLSLNFSENIVARDLLLFSLPLLGVSTLQFLIGWTDTFMLGIFKASEDVGLYNAAYPLAQFISTPLGAMLMIYMPIVSGLYAKGLIPDIKRYFSVLTKWLCSLTLPLFLILFLSPETVLGFLFGPGYSFAANALRILSLGFIINNYLGPNGATLIGIGESKFMMYATLATATLNIGLNASLIPFLGIIGAATASVIARTSINVIRCWKLYLLTKAIPLSKNIIKPTLGSLAVILLLKFLVIDLIVISWWMLPILFALYYLVYGLFILVTKSFDQEDIEMLLLLEKRVGVDATPIKNTLRKFL